jgi:uncharacterized membrane protein
VLSSYVCEYLFTHFLFTVQLNVYIINLNINKINSYVDWPIRFVGLGWKKVIKAFYICSNASSTTCNALISISWPFFMDIWKGNLCCRIIILCLWVTVTYYCSLPDNYENHLLIMKHLFLWSNKTYNNQYTSTWLSEVYTTIFIWFNESRMMKLFCTCI